jgi:heme-degrading monooxygenase HmoA
MYSRIIQYAGATDIDAGVAYVRDTVAPLLRQQKGFRGVTVSADRSQGLLGVLSLWETAADREASDSALAKARDEGQKLIGGTMTVERFEETTMELVGPPPSAGASLLIRRLQMDPARVAENLDYFKQEVLPQIKTEPGLLAVRQMVNRDTGEAVVGTVWQDAAAMKAGAASAARRQQQAGDRVTFGEQSEREILFIDLP